MNTFEKYKITILISAFMLLVSAYYLLSTYFISNSLSNQTLVISRGYLEDYELINHYPGKPLLVDIKNLKTNTTHFGVNVSNACPNYKNRINNGMKMKLVMVENLDVDKSEKFTTFDRLYDYLCSNKNMVEEDKILMDKILEAREKALKELKNSVLP